MSTSLAKSNEQVFDVIGCMLCFPYNLYIKKNKNYTYMRLKWQNIMYVFHIQN